MPVIENITPGGDVSNREATWIDIGPGDVRVNPINTDNLSGGDGDNRCVDGCYQIGSDMDTTAGAGISP